MADIITNLHPDGDENTNLYPNIKKENIPSKSISTDKLDDNVLSLIGSLKPSGTDTSTNILAFTSNKGIYVATDNGHWYYWNGSVYVDGGVYQTDLSYDELREKLVNLNSLLNQISFFNYYDFNKAIDNYRLLPDGNEYSDNGYFLSDYIMIDKNTNYIKNSPVEDSFHRYALYDENKNNIEVNTSNIFNTGEAYYVRICGLISEKATTTLNKGESQGESTAIDRLLRKNISTPEMYGAKGNGVNDDTEAFRNAINDSRTIILDGKKTYIVNNLEVSVPTTILGNGAIIMSNISKAKTMTFKNTNNILLENFVDYSLGFHIEFDNCYNFIVQNVRISSPSDILHNNDGIRILGSCNNFRLENIYGISRDDFIALNACEGHYPGNITNGVIRNIRTTEDTFSSVRFYGIGQKISNIRFENCLFHGNGEHVIRITNSVSGLGDQTKENIIIDNVSFSNCTINAKSENNQCVYIDCCESSQIIFSDCLFYTISDIYIYEYTNTKINLYVERCNFKSYVEKVIYALITTEGIISIKDTKVTSLRGVVGRGNVDIYIDNLLGVNENIVFSYNGSFKSLNVKNIELQPNQKIYATDSDSEGISLYFENCSSNNNNVSLPSGTYRFIKGVIFNNFPTVAKYGDSFIYNGDQLAQYIYLGSWKKIL